MGYLDVSAGQVIASAHMDLAIGQSIMRFANSAERDAQLPTPSVGMFCYLLDLNYLMVFDPPITGGANAWRVVGSLRMGYASVGLSQSIPNNSTQTLLVRGTVAGAGNKTGRATFNADGSVTLPLSGTYLVTGDITWPANSTGERRLYIMRYYSSTWAYAGVSGGVSEINTGAVGSTLLRQEVTAMVAANAGDKVGLFAQHSANAALTLPAAGGDASVLAVHLLGAD